MSGTSSHVEQVGQALVVGDLLALGTEPSQPEIYDRPVGVRLLHRDPRTGAEHWLVHYPPGLVELRHRHSAAHTVVVLAGALDVDGVRVGAGGWCHFPAGTAMHHVPADGEACTFFTVFDGPFDVEPLPSRTHSCGALHRNHTVPGTTSPSSTHSASPRWRRDDPLGCSVVEAISSARSKPPLLS